MIKIKKRKLLLFIPISLIVFTFYYLFHTGKIIYWKNPLLLFQPVTPSFLVKYPVFRDCKIEKGKYTDGKSEYGSDGVATKALERNVQIMEGLKLRDDYELGRVREVFYGIPTGSFCNNWFNLTVRKKSSRKIIEGNDRANAFVIDNEEDLKDLGIILFGEPQYPGYETLYNEWNSGKDCSGSNSRRNCKIQYLPYPKSIFNGQVVVGENGEITLHRIIVGGMLSNHSIVHTIILKNPEGSVTLNSEELLFYDDGRLF